MPILRTYDQNFFSIWNPEMAYILGYFDGDGCVYFSTLRFTGRVNRRWILVTLFTSGSLVFLESLHKHLHVPGVQKEIISPRASGAYELRFSHHDSLALYKLMYHTAEDPALFLPRKREKLEQVIRVLGLEFKVRS